MALVTFDSVAAAAEALIARGDDPSARLVLAEIGGGSMTTVLRFLQEWRAGRVAVRSTDFELDPRIGQYIAETVEKAAAQASKGAEERASQIQEDLEAVTEAARDAEAKVQTLENLQAEALQAMAAKDRALENLQAEASIQAKNSQDRINALQLQLQEERTRADQAVQAEAKAQVRLELIPGLQAEVERLKPWEQKAAVLSANLEAATSRIEDLQGRLAEALADAKTTHVELEKARGSEQALQAKFDAGQHEIHGLQANLSEVKGQLSEARQEAKEARSEAKEARTEAARSKVQPER